MSQRLALAAGLLASAALLAAPRWTDQLAPLEPAAATAYAWSVALLARNHPAGWWLSLVGCALYAEVFRRAGLVVEVGLMGFYFVTSAQALWLWARGGPGRAERPIARVPRAWLLPTAALAAAAWAGLREVSARLGGAAPGWDALVTALSLVGHVWLMFRFVEAWPVWVAVDAVGVPLYAARGLTVTSALYAVFLVMALRGWATFHAAARAGYSASSSAQASAPAATSTSTSPEAPPSQDARTR